MAEGGQAHKTLSKFRKELTCSDCSKLFKEPKTLSCLHTFCEKCLSDYIACLPVEPDPLTGYSQTKVPCPLCKNVQELKEADVKHVPFNFSFKNMVSHLTLEENVRKASGSQPDRAVRKCEECTDEDKAVAFCKTCNQHFCEGCSTQHKKSKKYTTHKVLALEKISSSSSQIVTHKTWKCTKHDSKVVDCDYYCETCDEVICSKCAIIEPHGNHEKYEASTIIGKEGYKPLIEEHEGKVKAVQEKFKTFINEMDNLKVSLKANQEKAMKEIDEKLKVIQAKLERERKGIVYNADAIFERKKKRLEEQLEELHHIDRELEDCRKFVNDTLTYGIPEEILFLKTKMIHRMKHLRDMYNSHPLTPRENNIITFDENTTLDLSGAIGSVSADPFPPAFTADNLKKIHFIRDQQASVIVTCRDIAGTPCPGKHRLRAELIPQPNGDAIVGEVRGEEEGRGEYIITFQPTVQGNHSLKISVIANEKEVPIKRSPYNINVSAPVVNEIQAENITVPNMNNPWGVAVSNGGEIVISDIGCHKLVVLSPDTFELVRWIGKEGEGNGEFKSPRGLAFNSDGDIAVVEKENHRVQIITIEGDFKRKFGKPGEGNGEFRGATYIVVDENGIMYVSDSILNRIQYFTAMGDYLGMFGCWGPLNGPYALALDAFGRILITEQKGNSIQFFKKKEQNYSSEDTEEPIQSEDDFSSGDEHPTRCAADFVYDFKTSFNLLAPVGIVFDRATNYIVVTENEGHRISVFNRNGEHIRSLGTRGMQNNEFSSPLGVATLRDSRIVVCDVSKAKLMMFKIV